MDDKPKIELQTEPNKEEAIFEKKSEGKNGIREDNTDFPSNKDATEKKLQEELLRIEAHLYSTEQDSEIGNLLEGDLDIDHILQQIFSIDPTEIQEDLAENQPNVVLQPDATHEDQEEEFQLDYIVGVRRTEENPEATQDSNNTEDELRIELRPTDGVVDYATQYKKVLDDKRELIQSARYFVTLRKQYIAEVMGSWDDISKDIPLEVAEILLNEFLSPKFTLLEFEYKNLTKAGRKEREEVPRDETLSEIWQKHILGKVLTDNEENRSSVSITDNEKGTSDDCETDVTKETETGTTGGETSDKLEEAGLTDADKELTKTAVEIFSKITSIYKRVKWFIRYIDVDKLDVCNDLKRTIRTGIITFNRSLSVTWRVVNCLVYMEILESVRKDPSNALKNVLIRLNRMLVEERMGVFTEESGNMLKVAHLFIDKYRRELNEDALFRRGFGYLSRKLTKLKKDNTNAALIMNVASHLANEETKISEVHEVLKKVFNFEILKL